MDGGAGDGRRVPYQPDQAAVDNPTRRVCATEPHLARRYGWYAIVRALQPDNVVETGTHLGLGSCVIAAALLRNGHGRLTTIDIDADSGYLIDEPWASVIDRRVGSSLDELAKMSDVDMFLHDSLHTYEYETKEFAAVEPNLRPTPSSFPITRTTPRRCRTGRRQRSPLPVLQGAAPQPLVARGRHRGRLGEVMYHREGIAALLDMHAVLRRMLVNAAPRLSVGLPVLNGEHFIAESLEALLGQSYTNFELIIADNASTDDTGDICRKYAKDDSRIRYHRHPQNIGLAPNHNFVVQEARGELFKWAANDDLYASTLLARCVEALDEYPDVVLAHSWTAKINSAGNVTKAFEYPTADILAERAGSIPQHLVRWRW